MTTRKSPSPIRRDSFEFKAWPPTVTGEGSGVWVAIIGLIVLAVMCGFGMNRLTNADMKLTLNVVQQPVEPPERPPPP